MGSPHFPTRGQSTYRSLHSPLCKKSPFCSLDIERSRLWRDWKNRHLWRLERRPGKKKETWRIHIIYQFYSIMLKHAAKNMQKVTESRTWLSHTANDRLKRLTDFLILLFRNLTNNFFNPCSISTRVNCAWKKM